jgi:hypothetical protein
MPPRSLRASWIEYRARSCINPSWHIARGYPDWKGQVSTFLGPKLDRVSRLIGSKVANTRRASPSPRGQSFAVKSPQTRWRSEGHLRSPKRREHAAFLSNRHTKARRACHKRWVRLRPTTFCNTMQQLSVLSVCAPVSYIARGIACRAPVGYLPYYAQAAGTFAGTSESRIPILEVESMP